MFRLALHLGFAHPDELTARLSASQLAGWRAYGAIEPFGEYRAELRHGQLMQLTDAAHFKRDTPASVADFMNFIDRPENDDAVDFDRIDKELFDL